MSSGYSYARGLVVYVNDGKQKGKCQKAHYQFIGFHRSGWLQTSLEISSVRNRACVQSCVKTPAAANTYIGNPPTLTLVEGKKHQTLHMSNPPSLRLVFHSFFACDWPERNRRKRSKWCQSSRFAPYTCRKLRFQRHGKPEPTRW